MTGDQNNDIVDHNGTVTFGHDIVTADIGLKVRGDTLPELDELFVVHLTAVSKVNLHVLNKRK